MYNDFTLKIKALALTLAINGLMLSGAAYLFDGQLHTSRTDRTAFAAVRAPVRDSAKGSAMSAVSAIFRP
jgi:hypothetical protein